MTNDIDDGSDGIELLSSSRAETTPFGSSSSDRATSVASVHGQTIDSTKSISQANEPATIHQAARTKEPSVVPGPGDEITESTFKIGIAEYALTVRSEYQYLRSSGFGSCIGVVLHDESAAVTGLLHFMLPSVEKITNPDQNPAKFGDSGVEAMIDSFRDAGGSVSAIEARLAGGAKMMNFENDGNPIGKQNLTAARAILERYGIPVIGTDTGGSIGRSLTVDTETGSVWIQRSDGSESVV